MYQDLKDRRLPALLTDAEGKRIETAEAWRSHRKRLLDLLSRQEYGVTPDAPKTVRGEILKERQLLGQKALRQRIRLSFQAPLGSFSFEFELLTPTAAGKHPVFLRLSGGFLPDFATPTEEILDRGYAIANIHVGNISSDSAALDGLAAVYPADAETGWGKIGMWAFGASRVLDYLETLPDIDSRRAAILGHSRLGKTALWCGAQDERFSMVIGAGSGCSGAALARGGAGETVEAITSRFPYWFCKNYAAWAGREAEMPFDQHMLLALTAPRKLYVSSASEDEWANPQSEFLSCVAASEAWTVCGVPGLVTPDDYPRVDAPLMSGGVCYHMRKGKHFLGRQDWLWYLECRDRFHI